MDEWNTDETFNVGDIVKLSEKAHEDLRRPNGVGSPSIAANLTAIRDNPHINFTVSKIDGDFITVESMEEVPFSDTNGKYMMKVSVDTHKANFKKIFKVGDRVQLSDKAYFKKIFKVGDRVQLSDKALNDLRNNPQGFDQSIVPQLTAIKDNPNEYFFVYETHYDRNDFIGVRSREKVLINGEFELVNLVAHQFFFKIFDDDDDLRVGGSRKKRKSKKRKYKSRRKHKKSRNKSRRRR